MVFSDWLQSHAQKIFFALGVIVVIANCLIIVQVQARAQCQTNYNKQVATVITTRGHLAEAADANQNKLLGGVASLVASAPVGHKPTKAEQEAGGRTYRTLLADFAKEAARIKLERSETPLPKIPSCA